jgi:hypothetical protein
VTLSPAHALFIAKGFAGFLAKDSGKAEADIKISVRIPISFVGDTGYYLYGVLSVRGTLQVLLRRTT